MTRTRLALSAFALLVVAACDSAPPPPKADDLAVVRGELADEAARLRRALGAPWCGRLPVGPLMRTRLSALETWTAEADALLAAATAAEAATRDRLAEDGRVLAATKSKLGPALAACESLGPAIDATYRRTAALDDAASAIGAVAEHPLRLRLEGRREALRTTEDAFSRALRRLVTGADDAKHADVDLKIAAAGFAEAERTGSLLADELDRLRRSVDGAKERRDQLVRRVAWATDVAAAAGSDLPAEAAVLLASTRSEVEKEIGGAVDRAVAQVSRGEAGAAEAVAAASERVDRASRALVGTFLEIARRRGAPDPP